MKNQTIEQRILRQLAYYPQFRGVAKVVLKPVVFQGYTGKVTNASIFDYITSKPDVYALDVMEHFKNSEVVLMLISDDLPTHQTISYASFFLLLEIYVKSKLLDIVATFHDDHFRDECFILLNSEVDFFEKVDTLKNFLAHYKHPGLAAVEEIALVLDEKVLKIKQNHRAFQLMQQAATLLELHHHKDTIDTLFQPIYDLC